MLENFKKHLPIASVLLLASAQFLCAFGSLSPPTHDPLSDTLIGAANAANGLIGIMALIPRTRTLAACLSVLITLGYTARNYFLIDYNYFLQWLAFDLVLIGVSLYVYFHYRQRLVKSEKNSDV